MMQSQAENTPFFFFFGLFNFLFLSFPQASVSKWGFIL